MKKKGVILASLILIYLLLTNVAVAGGVKILRVTTGQSKLLKVVDLKRVAITDPQIADVITISNQEILVNGKKKGKTTLHIWEKKGHQVYQVKISKDKKPVINQIKDLIGIETVGVAKVDNNIILTGTVKNQNQLKKAKKVAGVFGEQVIDQLEVSNSLQVLLEAQIFEINKTASEELGFDWYGMRYSVGAEDGANVGSGTAVFGDRLYKKVGNDIVRKGNPKFGLGQAERISELRTKLKALNQNDQAKLLAKPKLVTKSGKEAEFSVGGEIPIVTTNSSGEQTVVWKKYGVQFKIKPTVTKTGKLNTYLSPKVSRLDWANAVEYGNGRLPAIKSSEVTTEVVISDGSTLAIGGLIQKQRSKNIKKLPLLGDLPILGTLFKSEGFQEGKSELIILVTPKIINSTEAAAVKSEEEIDLDDTLKEKEEFEKELNKKEEPQEKSKKESKKKSKENDSEDK